MGWKKVLTDFAIGYVEERGIEGTIEDMTKVVQRGGKVINKYGQKINKMCEDNTEDYGWDDFFDEYQACLDNNQYEEAIELLDFYFEQCGNENPFSYYYLRANALIQQWDNSEELGLSEEDEVPLIIQSSKDIKECIKWAEDIDQQDLAASLQEDFDNVNNRKKNLGLCEKAFGEMEKYRDSETVYASSDAEKEYLEELRECLKDGITDKVRRLLNRLRQSLGISEERAIELEKSLTLSLSDEEQEYLEELKECLKDDGISDKERRLLNRIRQSLGISEERGKELEQLIHF